MGTSILDQFRLPGQTALIVGGNRGLGFAMAQGLADAGANIVLAARDADRNAHAAAELEKEFGRPCLAHACDVTREADVAELVRAAESRFGKIDILINSAGINLRGPIEEMSLADFEQVQRVNVTGSWLTARAVVPGMKKRGYGRIVNMASMISVIAIPNRTPYAASKGAVLQLTRALAVELAPWKITANAILPGFFATEMNLVLTADPEVFAQLTAKVPLQRWGELSELQGLALYLSSPASSYVTGGAFLIDGGYTAQ